MRAVRSGTLLDPNGTLDEDIMSTNVAPAGQRRAMVSLYRTMMRMTHKIDPNVALGAHVQRLLPDAKATKIMASVQELQGHIRVSFRADLIYVSAGSFKEKMAEGIQGVRQLDQLLHSLKFNAHLHADETVDDTKANKQSAADADLWAQSYIDEVEWLPNITELDVVTLAAATTSTPDADSSSLTRFPLFPLNGPFYTPNEPLSLFVNSYWQCPMPGTEIVLKIFEPRYRAMYDTLLSTGSKRFAVPFGHPTETGKFARMGLVYEITNVQEVADETQGRIHMVCNHVVTKPVRMESIVNPTAWLTQETYLEVDCQVMDEWEQDDWSRVESELDQLAEKGHRFARKARDALVAQGLWGFADVWNASAKEELLKLEMQIAAEVRLLSQNERDTDTEKLIAQVREKLQTRRKQLLSLNLDIALLVPKLLQSSGSEREQVLLRLIKTEESR
jgi:Lon protease-like protein